MLRVAKSMAMQITGGSLSIRSTGQYGMRIAGAAAREMLIEAADAGEFQLRNTNRSQYLIHAATNRRALCRICTVNGTIVATVTQS